MNRDWMLSQTRRHFFKDCALGVGKMALASMLAESAARGEANPLAPRTPHFLARAKSVIFLFMAGGPSQMDLFEPKPVMRRLHGQPVPASFLQNLADPVLRADARVMASPRTFTKYGHCGMDFSDFLPHLGTCADDLCMVRSMHTSTSNHDPGQLLMNCGTPLYGHPSMGSWVTYGLGSPSQDLPGFIVLLSNSGGGVDGGTALWSNGFLPSHYRGVTFRHQGDPILYLANPDGISATSQRARLSALGDLNRLRQEDTGDAEITSRIAAYELAYRMQLRAPELVDFSGETRATQDMYGIHDPKTRWFGSNCLLARRMVERGVRFVQLYHATWDDHSGLNANLGNNCAMTDRPAAALIKDLKRRGLLEETLVIWGGEFGRTPMNEVRRSNTPDGRDHHPFAFTMLMAGGGIKGGQIVGRTDELAYHVVEDPIHVHDLQATVLHCLGIDHTRLTFRHQGRDFRLTDVAGRVVTKLLA